MARNLRCPQCQQINRFDDGQPLVCANCKYGAADAGAAVESSNGTVETVVQTTPEPVATTEAAVTTEDPETEAAVDDAEEEWNFDEIEWDNLTKEEVFVPFFSFQAIEVQLTDRKISHVRTKSSKTETTVMDLASLDGISAQYAIRWGVWLTGVVLALVGIGAAMVGGLQGDIMAQNNLIMLGGGAVLLLAGIALIAARGSAVSMQIFAGTMRLRIQVRPKFRDAMERFMANTMAAKDHKLGR